MGFLKHFLLPTFALADGYTALKCLNLEFLNLIAPGFDRDMEKEPPTEVEKALSRTIGGAKLAFCINCIVASVNENSHYRGMTLLVETIYIAVDTYSAKKANFKDMAGIYTMLGLSLFGLGIHAMEPGIFAKDKTKL